MDTLPFEVLDKIFTRLHFVNKLECMHVCRLWANVIRENSLLHTASIIEGGNIDVNSLFSLLEREPWRRKQMKNLLYGYSDSPSVGGEFFRPDLLVNLKFLYLSREKGVYNQYIQHLPRESVAPFMNSIKHVEDRAGSGFVDELLATGTCPRLTTLVLWLIFYNEVDDIHQAMEINGDNEDSINEHNLYLNKRIISHLFNAPALRKLEFTNFDLQISDFEVIHTSLPQLESLTIRSSTLRGDELPDGVIPTDSLKKLSLVLISINSLSLSNMIRYMIKKYTCLQELIIDPCYDSFVLEIHLPPDSFVQETDANAIMTKFSKQLTTLKLPIKSGFVKWVCGFDCQLSAFTIDKRNSTQSTLETLSRFPQRAFLKELSILCPFYFDPAPLKELSHLKKLCISCRGMTQDSNTDIVSVLRCCSDHLTSLILYWVALQDTLAMNHIFALQELKIYSDSLPKQLDLFLSKCCPRLRSLTLSRCFSAGDHLNLSELSLSYLKIQLSYPRVKGQPMQDFPSHPKTLFLVVTPKTEQLYYVDGCNDIGTREVFSGKKIYHLRYKTCFPIKPANLPVMEMTALYCRSVDTLIINDRIAC